MLRSRGFWYFMMAGAVCGWVFTVIGLVKPFKNETMKKLWKSAALTWILGHPLEILFVRGIGKAAGYTQGTTMIRTLIYGFTWWLPVKLGVFKG